MISYSIPFIPIVLAIVSIIAPFWMSIIVIPRSVLLKYLPLFGSKVLSPCVKKLTPPKVSISINVFVDISRDVKISSLPVQ